MDFQTLYQELAQSTEMIRALLAGISQEEAQIRPAADSWSILEVVCHLYDEEREDFREHLDFIISTSLNTGLHRQNEEWHRIDPQGWVTERKYNERDLAEMQKMFFEERAKSLEWLQSIRSADLEITYTSEFGSVTAGEMFACWVAHDNLHIRQFVELRRKHIERMAGSYDVLQYAGDW
ncbi:MAG: DinB family protein [Chloroflexi bacterium]|nr:DinB family protein [Chloroflexota bacterium]